METTKTSTSVHPQFWKDWKVVKKHHKSSDFKPILSDENGYNDEERLDLTPHLKAIKNVILNSLNTEIFDSIAPQYDRQPFLNSEWIIRKMRYAIDNGGKSSGLRIIFCVNKLNILFVFVATKNNCADERKLEKVFLKRITDFILV